MASESNSCIKCEKLHLHLIDKNNEIKELKMHIKNLTNFLLSKDNRTDSISNNVETYDFTIANKAVGNKERFFCSELFITTCGVLDKSIIHNSKSTQTDSNETCDEFHSIKSDNETSQSEVGNLPDYVYDQNYQMYYSLSTGYYYDEKSGLMYEPQSCTYLKYNYDKKEYEKVCPENYSNLVEAKSNVDKDGKEISEKVVEQVNNLTLNDDPTEMEKSIGKIKDASSAKFVGSSNESDKENCNMINMTLHEEGAVSPGFEQEWQPTEGSNLTVTDMVKQVVEEHSNMADYIYDETYKMYYSPSTGYYYDAVRNLLYDPTSGIFYSYDAEKQTYEFYSQTDPCVTDKTKSEPMKQDSVNKERLTRRKLYWKKKLESSRHTSETNCDVKDSEDFSSPEDGEILSSDDDSSALVCIVKSPIKGSNGSKETYPPSIRAIVEHSEKLQIGSLILITCSGGIIGREKNNAIYLPDICVSKMHAEIKYNNDFQAYRIEDLGSQNGTFINEKRLSEPKERSEPCTLNHGDTLSFGSCKLLLHIHDGYDTCDKCEPGQVLAEISLNAEKKPVFVSKEEIEKIRRQELKRLKQKYGLQGSNFERKSTSVTSRGYENRSKIRRQTVGSDNPYEKTEEASVDVMMSETNKGYQMLKKMGWKEGETLGKADSGLIEPIPLRPWTSKAGLGSACDSSTSAVSSLQGDKRSQKWVKAQERYFQLTAVNEVTQVPHQEFTPV